MDGGVSRHDRATPDRPHRRTLDRRAGSDPGILGPRRNHRPSAGEPGARSTRSRSRTWESELGDLVVVDGDEVSFRNDLVRVAAYEGLSVRRRRAVHRRAGEIIEEWGDSVPIADPVGASRFTRPEPALPERIVRWAGEAARRRSRGGDGDRRVLLDDVVAAQRRLGMWRIARSATLRRLAFAAERVGHPERALDVLVEAARLDRGARRASSRSIGLVSSRSSDGIGPR